MPATSPGRLPQAPGLCATIAFSLRNLLGCTPECRIKAAFSARHWNRLCPQFQRTEARSGSVATGIPAPGWPMLCMQVPIARSECIAVAASCARCAPGSEACKSSGASANQGRALRQTPTLVRQHQPGAACQQDQCHPQVEATEPPAMLERFPDARAEYGPCVGRRKAREQEHPGSQ